MANRTITVRLRAEMSQFQQQWVGAGRAVQRTRKDLDDAVTSLDRMESQVRKNREAFETSGRALLGVGTAAGVAVGAAVVAATRFDKAMSAASAATQASARELKDLRQAAIDAGADTVFSATEAADGITELGKAGVLTKDILGGGLRGALDLAAAGEISVAEAAETAASTMNQFGLTGKDVTRIADVLAATAGKAQGGVTDVANALKYAGPVAASMGLTLEETAGTIGLLASNGILADQAGTSMRGMLTSLTSPSKAASDEMKRLKINVYDAQGQFIGFDGVAGQLQQRMGNLENAERDQALGRIFGNEQITAARILYAGGAKAVEEWNTKVVDQGFATELAAEKTNNLAGDLERLKGSLETALITTGEAADEPLRKLAQGGDRLVDAYNKAPGVVQQTTLALGGVVGVAGLAGGGLLVLAPRVLDTVDAFRTMRTEMPVATSRLTAAAKASAALTAAFTATAAASQLLASDAPEGVNRFATAILDMADGAKGARGDLDELFKVDAKGGALGTLYEDIDGLSDAISRTDLGKLRSLKGGLQELVSFGAAETESDAASKVITQYDQALASLVQSGNVKEAADGARAFAAAAYDVGVYGDEAKALLPGYADALAAVDNQQREAATSGQAAAGAVGSVADEMTEEELKAIQEWASGIADASVGFLSLSENADQAKRSLRQYIRDIEDQVEAQAEYVENMKTLISRGASDALLQSLSELGPEGAKRVKELADGSKKDLRRLDDAVQQSQVNIDELKHALLDDALDDDKNVTVSVQAKGVSETQAILDNLAAQSEGMPNAEFYVKPLNADGTARTLSDLEAQLTGMPDATPAVRVAGVPAAKRQISDIKKAFNQQLSQIKDEGVKIELTTQAKNTIKAGAFLLGSTGNANVFGAKENVGMWSGGPVHGPGTGTSDEIPTWLSNNEHVVTAAEVSGAGGHRNVEVLRSLMKTGRIATVLDALHADVRGYRDGGAVTRTVSITPRASQIGLSSAISSIEGQAEGYAAGIGRLLSERISKALLAVDVGGHGGIGGLANLTGNVSGRTTMDGEPVTNITKAQILLAESLSKIAMRVMQGSFQPATSYSGTSHTGAGVVDTSPGNFAAQAALRRAGFAAWGRNFPGAKTAGSGAHVHSVSLLDPGSRNNGQARAFKAGGDGLGGRDYGPNPSPLPDLASRFAGLRDRGGLFPAGSFVGNASGRPEWVLDPAQAAHYARGGAVSQRGIGDAIVQDRGDTKPSVLGTTPTVTDAMRKALRDALREFELDKDPTADEVKSELTDLLGAIEGSFGEKSKLYLQADRLGEKLLKSSTALDKEIARRDELAESLRELKEQRASEAATLAEGFTPDVLGDFAVYDSKDKRSFVDRLSDAFGQDTALAVETDKALQAARARGLDGALYDEVARSNNFSLQNQFANASRVDIARLERDYAARSTAAAAFGQTATANLGEAIKAQNTLVAENATAVRSLTSRLSQIEQRIEAAVAKGSEQGTRAGYANKARTEQANNRNGFR